MASVADQVAAALEGMAAQATIYAAQLHQDALAITAAGQPDQGVILQAQADSLTSQAADLTTQAGEVSGGTLAPGAATNGPLIMHTLGLL